MPSPAASSRPADSDHGYTLLWDEPAKATWPVTPADPSAGDLDLVACLTSSLPAPAGKLRMEALVAEWSEACIRDQNETPDKDRWPVRVIARVFPATLGDVAGA